LLNYDTIKAYPMIQFKIIKLNKIKYMKNLIQFPFPVFVTTEDDWFVAECPILSIATQGKTEKEAKDNLKDLIKDYLEDPDTSKEELKNIKSSSLSYIPFPVSTNLLYG